MARTTDEWVGTHDDQTVPPRVRLRVFERANKHCQKCTRQLRAGKWAVDHIVALANGGEHRESNFQALCTNPCHSDKTIADVREKSLNYRVKAKHYGIKKKKWRPMPGTRASGTRKRMSGDVEKW